MNVDSPQFRIAAARRILANGGCESMVAGHVSERSGPDAFWISPFEYFDETRPERIIEVGFDMVVRSGSWEASPAVQFHAAIYEQRPDVSAIVHTHSTYISALTTKQEPVQAYNIVAAPFVGKQALYFEDGEQPPVEGKLVAAALAERDALLISNHGVILVGASLEEATMHAVLIEQAARHQLEATAVGGRTLPDDAIERRAEFFRREGVHALWNACLDRLPKTDPDLFALA
ncbi:MAG: L-fuculose-phosphate aldolase [Pseudonocardiales bacterium]|nr:L-fuculose-phosphate aldolase [Pseudonocardiales bacterium]